MTDKEISLRFEEYTEEINRLNNVIKLKDSIIKKYEDVIQDVGARLEIVENKCPDLDPFIRSESTIMSYTIEFPKYQFAYKNHVRDMRDNLRSAISQYKMINGEKVWE